MYAIVQRLAGIVGEVVAEKFSDRELKWGKADRAELAGELFHLYLTLNDVLVTGRQILKKLDDVDGRVRESGKSYSSEGLPLLVQQQRFSMLRLDQSIKRLTFQIDFIPAAAYVKVAWLLHGNHNVLGQILHAMDHYGRWRPEECLGDIDDAAIDAMVAAFLPHVPPDVEAKMAFLGSFVRRADMPREAHFPALTCIVRNVREFTLEDCERVRAYTEQFKPLDRLTAVERTVRMLHKAVTENFAPVEFLPTVGDDRNTLWHPWVY